MINLNVIINSPQIQFSIETDKGSIRSRDFFTPTDIKLIAQIKLKALENEKLELLRDMSDEEVLMATEWAATQADRFV